MLKIIIPLAGPSELFSNAGYYYPKPLIEINGKIMIEHVLQNPTSIKEIHRFIFIITEEDATKFHLDNVLKLLSQNCDVIKLKKPTKGGLCSTLMAIDKIDSNDSLLILNGDQILDIDFNDIIKFWQVESVDVGLLTFKSVHPRWSYARIENDSVVQTAEKNPISNNAIAGYYYFKNATDFFTASFESIKNDVQLDGMFYIAPIINQYILRNQRVKSVSIEAKAYHSFYSPQMVSEYERKTQQDDRKI
ncbi:MAG: glycosyltransferase family 2 protein [Sediminibacterium sp.]|nr:glycosyltransferase family 2 protein [Sediminibacterium sp.]TXT33836.1 MAG: nucleotidyl transferase [Chitinophagaceae bacterium]